MNNHFKIFVGLLISIMMVACAQVRSITGGEKDLTPPELLSAYPPMASTYFNEKTIILTFNEYVQLNNVSQELIVSPPLPHAPKVKVKHKSVVVQLQDELLPNTTYMFNFGDAITDVNENNKAANMLYVFSTGGYIDSLSIRGNVRDALLDVPYKGIKVMLFEQDTDMFSKKTLPVYFAKTKEDGSFVLPYLKNGTFFIYALDDQNSNYKWNDGEAFAMSDTAITVSEKDSTTFSFLASVPIQENPVVNDYTTDSVGTLKFTLNPLLRPIEISSLNDLKIIQTAYGDTLRAWLEGKPTNTMEAVQVRWNDVISDTVNIPFFEAAQKSKFQLMHSAAKKIRASDSLFIVSDQLIKLTENSTLRLLQDSLPMTGKIIADSPGKFLIDTKFQAGKNYSVEIFPGTFTNESLGENDTLSFSFATYKKDELGQLEFTLSGLDTSDHYVFYLIGNSGFEFLKKSHVGNEKIIISNLPAGDYKAKLLDDKNENGLFDPIQMKPYAATEMLYAFPEKISVRANWEVKLNWNLKK